VTDKGFTLIELMIVVAIISILVALAMPNLMESRKAAAEASAVSSLRTISSAQELYLNRFGTYGMLQNLRSVNMVDPILGAATTIGSPKSGYYFTVTIGGSGATWTCIARPSDWDSTGNWNYKIDQTGVIYHNPDDNGNTWDDSIGG